MGAIPAVDVDFDQEKAAAHEPMKDTREDDEWYAVSPWKLEPIRSSLRHFRVAHAEPLWTLDKVAPFLSRKYGREHVIEHEIPYRKQQLRQVNDYHLEECVTGTIAGER